MRRHAWRQRSCSDGACMWSCPRCGLELESDYEPREQESGDGVLMVFGPFDDDWRDVRSSPYCDEELVRRVMES